jgi:lysophospholipase L1-like esterase
MASAIIIIAALGWMAAPADPQNGDATRVLIVGDSTSQGSTGDWTWRYRLWKHLEATADRPVDFVGPRTDLFDAAHQQSGSHDYADPAFDQDHAAVWGAWLAAFPYPLAETVAAEQADVVLILLGINDLSFGCSSEELAALMTQQVEQIRSTRPGVTVILGDLPWSWVKGTEAFNVALARFTEGMSAEGGPVLLADTGTMVEGVDTYDRLHFSAAGEVQVAAGFADALASLGLGQPYPRPLPTVPNVPVRLGEIGVEPGDSEVQVSWTDPPGGTTRRLTMCDVTAGSACSVVPTDRKAAGTAVGTLVNQHTYSFTLRWGKANLFADVATEPLVATPRPRILRHIAARPGRHRITVAWEPVLGVETYRVRWGSRVASTTAVSVTLTHLRAGHSYRIRVKPLSSPEQAPVVITAMPSGPVPGAPGRLQISGWTLSWRAAEHATRYQIERAGPRGWHTVAWTPRHHVQVQPGTYRVTSWHQDLPGSSRTVTVTA